MLYGRQPWVRSVLTRQRLTGSRAGTAGRSASAGAGRTRRPRGAGSCLPSIPEVYRRSGPSAGSGHARMRSRPRSISCGAGVEPYRGKWVLPPPSSMPPRSRATHDAHLPAVPEQRYFRVEARLRQPQRSPSLPAVYGGVLVARSTLWALADTLTGPAGGSWSVVPPTSSSPAKAS